MFYVQLKCYQFLVQLSSCIHRQIRWKVALTLRISSLCGHSLTSRRHEEIHVDVDSVKDLSAFHYFLQKDKKKTISIFLKLHFQTHKPNWASFSGSTVSSVVNWSIFGLQTWNIFSSGLSLAGSQFAFLCFLKHSKEQLKDQKITINWFFQEGEFLDDLHNNHIPIVFTSWTFIFFRCFFTFWTLHFSILFVRSIKETKPKQCANTCQNWHVTSILVLVL